MNNNENDKFFDILKDLDDDAVEEIVENYPALDEISKQHILNKCLENNDSSEVDWKADEFEEPQQNVVPPAYFLEDVEELQQEEEFVDGVEQDKRPAWYKYISTAVAFFIMLCGIGAVVYINRNMRENAQNENTRANEIQEIKINSVDAVPASDSSVEYSADFGNTEENTYDYDSAINQYVDSVEPVVTTVTTGYQAVVKVPETTAVHVTQPPATEPPVVTEPPTEAPTEPPVTEPPTLPPTEPPVTESPTEMPTEPPTTQIPTEPPTEPQTTEPITEPVINEAFPLGIWYANSSAYGSRQFEFYFDFSGGHFVSDESGIGLSFTWEISGNVITFHMAEPDNMKTAVIRWIDDYNFVLDWEDGISETFTSIPPEIINQPTEYFEETSY